MNATPTSWSLIKSRTDCQCSSTSFGNLYPSADGRSVDGGVSAPVESAAEYGFDDQVVGGGGGADANADVDLP
jgi:hypothetical protein